MSRHKCSECGLVNFSDQESCKRCQTPLHKLNGQPDVKRDTTPIDVPSLSTFNGIGTRLLGWRQHEDGTATATVWFTFLYLPLFPMGRWRLVSPTPYDFEPTFSLRQLFAVLLPDKSVTTGYSFVEWLKISGEEVLFTYLYAYLWVPFKVVAPIWLLIQFRPPPDKNDGSVTGMFIVAVLSMVWLGYVLTMFTRLLHQTRGGR